MSDLALYGGTPIRTGGPDSMWPVVGELEKQYLCEVIDSGKLLYGQGDQCTRFEEELADWMGVKYALGTVNGTETMSISLKAAGIGPGDEVIMPALTFLACPLAVLLAQAIPVLADVKAEDMALDPAAVEMAITENTKAIMAVSLYGLAVDMDAMTDICKRHNLFLLEDVAQAQGTEWNGKNLGTIGDAGSLSFHTAKTITSGDGGAILTDDKELRDLCQSYRQFGLPFAGAEHEYSVAGGNYRMSEFVGAVLRAQMRRIDGFIEKRNESARILDEMLKDIPMCRPMKFPEQVTRRSYLNYVMLYDQEAAGGVHRDVWCKALATEGVSMATGYAYVLNEIGLLVGPLRDRDRDRYFGRKIDYANQTFPVAKDLVTNSALNLSQHWLLADEQTVRDIGTAIQKVSEHVAELQDETL